MIDGSQKLVHFTEKGSSCVVLSLASSAKREQQYCNREMHLDQLDQHSLLYLRYSR